MPSRWMRPPMSRLLLAQREREADLAQDRRVHEAVQERRVKRALYSSLGRSVEAASINPPTEEEK